MGLREEFQKRIDRKQEEIRNFELQIREASAYIAALQEAIRMLPRDSTASQNGQTKKLPRPGTALRSVYDTLKKTGKPMHITEILRAIGKPVDKSNRVALAGSLAAYVRDQNTFTRPEPNTFGLIEMAPPVKTTNATNTEPPDDFGLLPKDEIDKEEEEIKFD